MSEQTVTTWTCTRCGDVEEEPGNGQPKLWVRVYFATPPRGETRALDDLCNPCGGLLVSFVHGTEVEDAAKEREIAEAIAEVTGDAA